MARPYGRFNSGAGCARVCACLSCSARPGLEAAQENRLASNNNTASTSLFIIPRAQHKKATTASPASASPAVGGIAGSIHHVPLPIDRGPNGLVDASGANMRPSLRSPLFSLSSLPSPAAARWRRATSGVSLAWAPGHPVLVLPACISVFCCSVLVSGIGWCDVRGVEFDRRRFNQIIHQRSESAESKKACMMMN